MPDLTNDAIAALGAAAEDMTAALQLQTEGSEAVPQVLAIGALVHAIEALCYEVAAHRDATFMRLTDIDSTLSRR